MDGANGGLPVACGQSNDQRTASAKRTRGASQSEGVIASRKVSFRLSSGSLNAEGVLRIEAWVGLARRKADDRWISRSRMHLVEFEGNSV